MYPVLDAVSAELLAQVEATATHTQAQAGQVLFDEGEAATHYPLLVEGKVRVSKRGPDGDELLLYHLAPGQSCALTAVTLLGDASYTATGTVESAVRLYALPRRVFMALVLEAPAFRVFVFSAVSRRLAQMMALVDEVTFKGIAQRLAIRLLKPPQPIEATHQTLADDLGTSREVVSRILERFQRAGLVRLGRGRIAVVDARALWDLGHPAER
jgi:CRP/FNR family transcriptional regulator